MTTVVYCPKCGEQHKTQDLEFLGIEESIEGWDVLEYICPETNEEAKAVVRNRGWD